MGHVPTAFYLRWLSSAAAWYDAARKDNGAGAARFTPGIYPTNYSTSRFKSCHASILLLIVRLPPSLNCRNTWNPVRSGLHLTLTSGHESYSMWGACMTIWKSPDDKDLVSDLVSGMW